MTWFRVGGAGIPASLKNAMNAVFNKKFGTSGQNYPPNGWPDDVNLLGPLPDGTASGPVATFTDGADDVPTKNVIATIAPTLTGVSSVDVVNCGKNLYDVDGAEYNGEFYDSSGNIVQYADCAVSWIKVNPSTQYSFSCTKETSQTVNVRIAWCKSDKSFISRQGLFSDNQFPMTLTTPSNCEWVQLSVNQYGAASIAQNNWSIQVEKSAASTTFEPYSGTTHTANLVRTIHGGTADLVNGVGRETSIMIDLAADIAASAWNMGATDRFCARLTQYQTASGWSGSWQNTVSNVFICENPSTPFNNRLDYSFANIPQNYYNFDIKVPSGQFENATEFAAWLANTDGNGNHAIIVIDRATPVTFTFDGQEINSLYGENNFWNDVGGDTTVVYRRDIDLALQAVSSSRGLMMASRPITQLVGEESDPDQVNELVENDETEQEGEDNAR